MNPVLACLYRRDESSLKRLLGGLDCRTSVSQTHLDEGLRVVLFSADSQDDYWTSSRVQIAEMLLKAGANENLYIDEQPFLCKMVTLKDTEMVMLLLFQFMCDTELKTKVEGEKDKTALHIAVEQRSEEMVQLLLSAGASTNIGDKCGNRPLHVLLRMFCCAHVENEDTSMKSKSLFDTLLPLTDLSLVNNEGYSMLHSAVACEAPSVFIEQIIHAGININHKNGSGETALIVACKCGNIDAVKVLTSAKCNLSLVNSTGDTATHYAAMHSTCGLEIMQLLLEKGVNVDIQNQAGLLPIHMSIKSGNVSVTKLLVKSNCNINKVGIIIFDHDRSILTLENDRLRIYDSICRFWNHFDFVELTLLVTAGCSVQSSAMNMIQNMALDVNSRKPMNWRSSLYGIKKGYNLQTLFLAAEILQAYAIQPAKLQHICRLGIRKMLREIVHENNHVTFIEVSKQLGLPESLLNYVRMDTLNALHIPGVHRS